MAKNWIIWTLQTLRETRESPWWVERPWFVAKGRLFVTINRTGFWVPLVSKAGCSETATSIYFNPLLSLGCSWNTRDTGSNALQKWPQPQMPVPNFLLLLRQLLLRGGGVALVSLQHVRQPLPSQTSPPWHTSQWSVALWGFVFVHHKSEPGAWYIMCIWKLWTAYENCGAGLRAVGGAGRNTRRDLQYYRRRVQLSGKKGLFWNQLLYNVDHKSLLGR